MDRRINFSIEAADITTFRADVVAFKYAQGFHGADRVVTQALASKGISRDSVRPAVGDYVYVDTRGAIVASHALFVGVPTLGQFSYPEIRRFAAQTLNALAKEAPDIRGLAMTIHGPGSGLDESEALLAQIAGYLDAQRSGQVPSTLEHIRIVNTSTARVERLRQVLAENVPNFATSQIEAQPIGDSIGSMNLEQAGAPNITKPHAFVAMPFSQEWGDTYFFGIQQPIHRLDLLCERIDQRAFTGDILEQIKTKIASARVVVAEVTDKNPNVFLEVGYAWGKGRPTVLLVRQQVDLPFDIQGAKCLRYDSIRHLEQALTKELTELKGAGII